MAPNFFLTKHFFEKVTSKMYYKLVVQVKQIIKLLFILWFMFGKFIMEVWMI